MENTTVLHVEVKNRLDAAQTKADSLRRQRDGLDKAIAKQEAEIAHCKGLLGMSAAKVSPIRGLSWEVYESLPEHLKMKTPQVATKEPSAETDEDYPMPKGYTGEPTTPAPPAWAIATKFTKPAIPTKAQP